MDVELRHLRAFAAVAEARSFTAASEELLLTQPALTRTIQQLESIREVTLLERTSRSVDLTETGRAFHTRVQALLRDLDAACAETSTSPSSAIPLAGTEMTTLTLFDEPRVAAVSRRSPLAGRDSLSWNELSQHPLIVNTRSGSTRPELWDPDHRPRRVVECDNDDERITLAAEHGRRHVCTAQA